MRSNSRLNMNMHTRQRICVISRSENDQLLSQCTDSLIIKISTDKFKGKNESNFKGKDESSSKQKFNFLKTA